MRRMPNCWRLNFHGSGCLKYPAGTGIYPCATAICSHQENELIKLRHFNDSDIPGLISEIPDARFLLQWAGPKYTFPLDSGQLNETLAKTTGEKPTFLVFKAIRSDTSETVGHIQLMNIDCDTESCFLGRVLIFRKYRGNGFGKIAVREAVRIAFEILDLNEIILGVFDFNTAAIELYKKIGFMEFQFLEGARQFKDEKWNLIRMKIKKIHWLQKNLSAPVSFRAFGLLATEESNGNKKLRHWNKLTTGS